MKPKVSIIIPVYNEEKDIGKALESLKQQIHKDFEIIIVDDGSTDNTLEIVRQFKARILNQNHQGPGLARNLGAKEAKGEILIFVDADMIFDKNYIKNLISPILKDKAGKIIGTTHDYEIATNIDNKWSALWGEIRVSKEQAKEVKIFRAIRKDKFIELGGFDQKYGYADDQTFWFKYKIKPIPAKNTTCYHKNPLSLKGTYKQARWIGASWKERYTLFKISVLNYLGVLLYFIFLPFLILAKSMQTKLKSSFSIKDIAKFYSVKFAGYGVGIFRAVYLNKVWK